MDADALFNPLLERAIELASQWHGGTYRKGRWREPAFEVPGEEAVRVPVIAHCTAVALIVQRAGWSDETVAAAFLHDTVEDANRHGEALRYEQLVEHMGERVAELVMHVTEDKWDEEGNRRSWNERKERYLRHLMEEAPDDAVAISLADKLHNLWTMNQSLDRGIDIFSDGPGRKGLSAGPERQAAFYARMLELAHARDDEQLHSLAVRLEREVERFRQLTSD